MKKCIWKGRSRRACSPAGRSWKGASAGHHPVRRRSPSLRRRPSPSDRVAVPIPLRRPLSSFPIPPRRCSPSRRGGAEQAGAGQSRPGRGRGGAGRDGAEQAGVGRSRAEQAGAGQERSRPERRRRLAARGGGGWRAREERQGGERANEFPSDSELVSSECLPICLHGRFPSAEFG